MRMTRERLTGTATLVATALASFALCLCLPSEVKAQWTTNGSNINNTNSGNVGVGTAAPESALHVSETSTTNPRGITVDNISESTQSSAIFMRKARGTPAAKTTLLNGDSISTLRGLGFDGTSFLERAKITFLINGAVSTNNMPTDILFMTGTNGNPAEKMRVTSGGFVGIGTAAPTTMLDVLGQIRSRSGGFVFPDGSTQATASFGTVTGVTAGLGLSGGGSAGSLTLNVAAGTGITAGAGGVSVNYGSAAGTAVQGNTTLTVTAGDGLSGGGSSTLGAGGTLTLTNNDKGSAQSIFKNVANAAGVTQFSAGTNNDSLKFEGTGGTTVSFDSALKKVTINGAQPVSYGATAGTAVQGNTTLTVAAGTGMSGGGTATLGSGGTLTLTNSDRGSAQNIFKNVTNAAGAVQFSAGTNSDAISFEGTGGTTVSFNAAAKKVTINSSATAASGWTDSGSILSTTNTSAGVGIGTSSPAEKLHVGGGLVVTGPSTEAMGVNGLFLGFSGGRRRPSTRCSRGPTSATSP